MKVVFVAAVVVLVVAMTYEVSADPPALKNCKDKCGEWADNAKAGRCKSMCPGCAKLARDNAGSVVPTCKTQECPKYSGDQDLCMEACDFCGEFAGEA